MENRRRILVRQKERYRKLNPKRVKWPEQPNVCAWCTAPINQSQNFCNETCKGQNQRLKRTRICVQCGLPWRVKQRASTATHCPECRPHRALGERPSNMSGGMRRTRRRQLAERDGERCFCCGATEGLEIHHRQHQVDGGGHELANLELLCEDCHRAAHGHVLALPLAA